MAVVIITASKEEVRRSIKKRQVRIGVSLSHTKHCLKRLVLEWSPRVILACMKPWANLTFVYLTQTMMSCSNQPKSFKDKIYEMKVWLALLLVVLINVILGVAIYLFSRFSVRV